MNEKLSIFKDPYLEHYSEDKKERIFDAIAKIQEMQKKWDVWGHGVETPEIAQKIIGEGLYTKWNTPQDIAHKLNTNLSGLIRQLIAWDYEARRYIILIALKKDITATDTYGMRNQSIKDAEEHVFKKGRHSTDPRLAHANKHVPKERIVGYWDAKNYQIHLTI